MSRLHGTRFLLGGLTLAVLTILSYHSVWHGGFIWDDDRYVTQNRLLTAHDGLRRIWFSLDAPSQYFPLTYTVFRVERAFFGLDPSGYHWVNILIHVLNALLLWVVLSRLKIRWAWLAAAVWALHPVQVESVAWISELKNVLMAFFFLLTLWMWSEYVDPKHEHRRLFYIASLCFYVLALSAKATACTLPAALILILSLKRMPIVRRVWLELIPLAMLALAAGLLTIWWEKYHQGTRVLAPLPAIERLLIASRAAWFYLSKIFWPSDLTFIYPQWKIDPARVLEYLPLVAWLAAAAGIYAVRRWLGRGLEVAMLFFVTTLAPLLGFFMLYTFRYTFVADHYQYLACIGPIALTCAGLAKIAEHGERLRVAVSGGVVVLLAALAVLTWRQGDNYRDSETLWRATIAKNPGCWMAYNNLGVVRFEKGHVTEALRNYKQSLELNPNYPEGRYNLAGALLQNGAVDKAIEECQKAIELQPNEPDAHVVLGNAFMAKGEIDRAIEEYRHALASRADDPNAHYNLAAALQQKGEAKAAEREFERAREIDSDRKQ